MKDRKIKVLMCCLGPETHNRGIITVSNILMEEGMEVVYMGNTTPANALKAAVEEDVQVVGVSSLSGAHLHTGKNLINLARERGLENRISFLIGGVIPPADEKTLREIGFRQVCPSGTKREELVAAVKDAAYSVMA